MRVSKQALDNVSSNTMIADPNGNIVYVNTAVYRNAGQR